MEKIIEEYPAYKINQKGEVFSLFKPKTNNLGDEWSPVKQVLDKYSGYFLVTLCDGKGKRQNKRIHRLLMEAFVPNPENKSQVNHIDGNKLNNCLSNLEWATSQENSQHAVDIGLCDERLQKASKEVSQFTADGTHIADFPSLHEAGRQTGVAWQNISKVVRGIRPRAGGYVWEYK